jgi:hypothetical protein
MSSNGPLDRESIARIVEETLDRRFAELSEQLKKQRQTGD